MNCVVCVRNHIGIRGENSRVCAYKWFNVRGQTDIPAEILRAHVTVTVSQKRANRQRNNAMINRVREEVDRHLDALESWFLPECKLTFIMRKPGNDDADLVITVDDIDELIAVLERTKTREAMP